MRHALFALAAATLSAGLLAAPTADACSCIPPTLQNNWGWSTNVMFLRVTSKKTITGAFGQGTDVYMAQVGRSWKGCADPGTRIRIQTPNNGAACGTSLTIGTQYLVTANQVGANNYEISLCGYNIPWSQVTASDKAFLNDHCPGGQGCCDTGGGECIGNLGSSSSSGISCAQYEPGYTFPADPLWEEVDLDAFQSMPQAEDLDYGHVEPGTDVTYWELRWGWGFGDGDQIIGAGGSYPCADASDFDACMLDWSMNYSEFEGFAPSCLPGYCFYYVAVNSGDENWTITTGSGFTSFLAPIDSPEEAALVALANGYNWNPNNVAAGGVAESPCGWDLLVTELVGYCDPVSSDRLLVRVNPDGTTEELGRQIYDAMCGVCI